MPLVALMTTMEMLGSIWVMLARQAKWVRSADHHQEQGWSDCTQEKSD